MRGLSRHRVRCNRSPPSRRRTVAPHQRRFTHGEGGLPGWQGCPIPPYMKGRSRIKCLFLSIVPDSPIGVPARERRQRDVGVNVGRCPPQAWR